MTEHKFTKEEIMKALECCKADSVKSCEECPYYHEVTAESDCLSKLFADALELIKEKT